MIRHTYFSPLPKIAGQKKTVSNINNALERDPKCDLLIAKYAIKSLHAELLLYPKPGLVSPIDNGSHADMNSRLFMRSIFCLRHYFRFMAQAGAKSASFEQLKRLGVQAERQMLRATDGINTHRGAIFSLGLLCAAAGHHYQKCRAGAISPPDLRATLLAVWGDALISHSTNYEGDSNGARAAAQYGVSGAREEAARGFPCAFETAVPCIQQSLANGRTSTEAQIDALFALMATMHDTNIYHRGGATAAALVKKIAQQFVDAGGAAHPDWYASATQYHQFFIQHRLSPGGAADLLSASWFIHLLSKHDHNDRGARNG